MAFYTLKHIGGFQSIHWGMYLLLCWLNRSAFEWILVGAAIQPWGHPKKEKTKARPRVIRSKHNPLRTESIRLSLAPEMQEACSWQRARDGRWMDENTLWHSGNSAGSFRWLILLSIKARPQIKKKKIRIWRCLTLKLSLRNQLGKWCLFFFNQQQTTVIVIYCSSTSKLPGGSSKCHLLQCG